MQADATGSHSVVAEGNSLHTTLTASHPVHRQSQNHVLAGFAVPLTLAEAMNNFACGQMATHVTIAKSDDLCSMQPGRDTRDFSTSTLYPQISSIQITDRLVEGIPLPAASSNTFAAEGCNLIENQENLTTLGSLAYPFECIKTAIASNSPNVVNSSFESMACGFEGLPFDSRTRWDLGKYAAPPELVGRVIGRTGDRPVQPIASCLPNEWMIAEQESLNSNSQGSSPFSNELSLSLATSQPSVLHGNSLQEQCSEMSSSGSRFVHAMQEILAEIASYALENIGQTSYSASAIEDGVNVSFSSNCVAGRGYPAIDLSDGLDEDQVFMNNLLQEQEVEAKKKHLLALLQVVDDRYNQCLDEIHTVTSAFHAVTKLDPNLHARFALPTISFMYKNLRARISSHILAVGAHLIEGEASDEKSFETCFIQKQWALQQLSKREHQLWRPQRGLPERSVSVLRAWMFQNFLHPYPKDAEKHLLALKSGLTRNQVSNWFINARVRLWKPMIEEMYAEMNRRKARRNDEETEGNHRSHMRFESTRFTMD